MPVFELQRKLQEALPATATVVVSMAMVTASPVCASQEYYGRRFWERVGKRRRKALASPFVCNYLYHLYCTSCPLQAELAGDIRGADKCPTLESHYSLGPACGLVEAVPFSGLLAINAELAKPTASEGVDQRGQRHVNEAQYGDKGYRGAPRSLCCSPPCVLTASLQPWVPDSKSLAGMGSVVYKKAGFASAHTGKKFTFQGPKDSATGFKVEFAAHLPPSSTPPSTRPFLN